MKRWAGMTSGLAFLAAAALAGAQGTQAPTAKEIMVQLNKGPAALFPTLDKALNADPPAWDKIQVQTREFAELAAALGRARPPRGDTVSWTRLTRAYADHARALDRAAHKKDKLEARAAHTRLRDSCKTCHDAHRNRGS